jgi:hypothetical protein
MRWIPLEVLEQRWTTTAVVIGVIITVIGMVENINSV